jgi:chromosome segregation ATPase
LKTGQDLNSKRKEHENLELSAFQLGKEIADKKDKLKTTSENYGKAVSNSSFYENALIDKSKEIENKNNEINSIKEGIKNFDIQIKQFYEDAEEDTLKVQQKNKEVDDLVLKLQELESNLKSSQVKLTTAEEKLSLKSLELENKKKSSASELIIGIQKALPRFLEEELTEEGIQVLNGKLKSAMTILLQNKLLTQNTAATYEKNIKANFGASNLKGLQVDIKAIISLLNQANDVASEGVKKVEEEYSKLKIEKDQLYPIYKQKEQELNNAKDLLKKSEDSVVLKSGEKFSYRDDEKVVNKYYKSKINPLNTQKSDSQNKIEELNKEVEVLNNSSVEIQKKKDDSDLEVKKYSNEKYLLTQDIEIKGSELETLTKTTIPTLEKEKGGLSSKLKEEAKNIVDKKKEDLSAYRGKLDAALYDARLGLLALESSSDVIFNQLKKHKQDSVVILKLKIEVVTKLLEKDLLDISKTTNTFVDSLESAEKFAKAIESVDQEMLNVKQSLSNHLDKVEEEVKTVSNNLAQASKDKNVFLKFLSYFVSFFVILKEDALKKTTESVKETLDGVVGKSLSEIDKLEVEKLNLQQQPKKLQSKIEDKNNALVEVKNKIRELDTKAQSEISALGKKQKAAGTLNKNELGFIEKQIKALETQEVQSINLEAKLKELKGEQKTFIDMKKDCDGDSAQFKSFGDLIDQRDQQIDFYSKRLELETEINSLEEEKEKATSGFEKRVEEIDLKIEGLKVSETIKKSDWKKIQETSINNKKDLKAETVDEKISSNKEGKEKNKSSKLGNLVTGSLKLFGFKKDEEGLVKTGRSTVEKKMQ